MLLDYIIHKEKIITYRKKAKPFFFMIILLSFSNTIFSQQVSYDLRKRLDEQLKAVDKHITAKHYNLALDKLESVEKYKNYVAIPKNRLEIGLKKAKIYFAKKEDQKAISVLLGNLGGIDKNTNNHYYCKYNNYLGDVFKEIKEYKRSLFYYNLSLKNSIKKKDSSNIINSYINLGSLYLNNKKLDSASINYKKVLEFPSTRTNEVYRKRAYNNLGVIASLKGDYNLAENYGVKQLNISKQKNDSIEMALALNNLGSVFYKKKVYEEAKNHYLEAYTFLKNNSTREALKIKKKVLINLSYINEEIGDYKKAYIYMSKYISVSEKLLEKKQYEDAVKAEATLIAQQKASEAKEAEDNKDKSQILFYSAAFSLITLLVLGYIFYRNYRLKQENKFEHIENEVQTKLINATIDAKEKERKAIAEILHDSVSALLSSANLHLQATKAQLKNDAPQEITKAQKIVNEASVKIRDLSHDLISSILLKFGLAFAIHDMCQKYSNSEITLHSDDDGVKRYDQDFEIKIHSIIEELINNILKHSKAANATVMISHRENDMLSVRISDDGIGFNPKNVKGKDGLGLSHIEARVKAMKGVFNIVSSTDNGTNIFILVPIKLKEEIVY